MTSRPNVPVIFPPASFIIRSAASHPPGPLGRVPRPHRYYQPTPTSRPPSRVTSFPSLSATTAPPSSLPRSRTIPRGPGPLLSRRPRRLSSVEKTRYPRFLGDPCVHAPLFDPGGPPTPGHYRTGDVVFRTLNNVDSAFAPFEARSRGLHALCVRFAAGVAPGPRNTRFRLVASLDRSGLSPAGSHRWFTVMSFRLHGVLHHQASPGAIKDGLGGGGWKRGLWWSCEPTSQPKGRGWKPSTYGCARQCPTRKGRAGVGPPVGENLTFGPSPPAPPGQPHINLLFYQQVRRRLMPWNSSFGLGWLDHGNIEQGSVLVLTDS